MRLPEDARLIKRLRAYANMQREEIIRLRAELYRAEETRDYFQDITARLRTKAK
jgi:hypothetical protein